jgi:hypothetical protein
MMTHHAIVFEGDKVLGLDTVKKHAEQTHGIKIESNPDFEVREYERFTIHDARALKERASQAPLGDKQVFVVATDALLREAQNALLKLLEEPNGYTFFYLLIPTRHELLQTVQSRVLFAGVISETYDDTERVEQYMSGTKKQQLALLEPIIKKKDRKEARLFLGALEAYLHKAGVQENTTLLREIYFVRKYLGDRSSSLKMLLEHLVVST